MSEKKEIAIKVEGVYKDFDLPHEINNNLKQRILHPLKRSTTEKQHALKDISFEIEKGDFFGIVGRNGSGKSTLLKIIAQIYTPTKGKVTVNGSLTPFIELGVGFNAELTGRENVFLNGAMLGFSKKEMTEMYDEIVEFAELEKFMDQKLKNYSSGMQVRLAFSVAIRAKSDILLLDEVLAVGDSVFQQKCFKYFTELKEQNKTVVFVSHDMESIKRYCNKCVLIKNSELVLIGSPIDVANQYLLDAGEAISKQTLKNTQDNNDNKNITMEPKLVSSPNLTRKNSILELELLVKTQSDIKGIPAISITKSNIPFSIAESNSGNLIMIEKNSQLKLTFKEDIGYLNGGNYTVRFCLLSKDLNLIANCKKTLNFNLENSDKRFAGIIKFSDGWK